MNVSPLKSDIANTFIFSSENLKKLQSIMYEQHFPQESYLFWEGDEANRLFFIVEGTVKVSKATEDGEDLELYHFTPEI